MTKDCMLLHNNNIPHSYHFHKLHSLLLSMGLHNRVYRVNSGQPETPHSFQQPVILDGGIRSKESGIITVKGWRGSCF